MTSQFCTIAGYKLVCMSRATPIGVRGATDRMRSQKSALAIIETAGDHRAVQVQQNGVVRGTTRPLHNARADVLVRVVFDRPAGPGVGGRSGCRFPPRPLPPPR